MFQSARLKLTGWYLLIIMMVSFLFSIIIYGGINRELERFHNLRNARIEIYRLTGRIIPSQYDPEVIDAARHRIIMVLIFINLGILSVSGIAAYFLSGKTLAPIKEMVEEQNRFITDASHELRTPLTSLRTEIEVNLRDKKLSLADAKKLLKSNLEEVISLQNLSDHLMSLTAYNSKNGSMVFEKMYLSELIDFSIKKIQAVADAKKIIFKKEMDNIEIFGNKQSLEELFVILLDNAIKYSLEGKQIEIHSKKTDAYAVVKIIDHGIGIKKEDIQHIFDRFYRADESRSKVKNSGYGLGLSIAKKIAESHHGKITVESKPGKGSSFAVILPVT